MPLLGRMDAADSHLTSCYKEYSAISSRTHDAYDKYDKALRDLAAAKAAWQTAKRTGGDEAAEEQKEAYDVLQDVVHIRKERYEDLNREKAECRRQREILLRAFGERTGSWLVLWVLVPMLPLHAPQSSTECLRKQV